MNEHTRRPSSVKRSENLRELVDELKLRDMSTEAVMELLGCVRSTARSYLHELLAKEVIHLRDAETEKWVPAPVYRLNNLPEDALLAAVEFCPKESADELGSSRDPIMAAFFGMQK